MTEILKKGSRGDGVKLLQRTLHLYEDGIFGPLTEEAVKEFQKSHGLVADGIVGAKTWAMLADLIGLKKSKRSINEIIVHCTASVEGKHFSVEDIRRWHKQRGWSDIGYHYVVYLDGSVHEGQPGALQRERGGNVRDCVDGCSGSAYRPGQVHQCRA